MTSAMTSRWEPESIHFPETIMEQFRRRQTFNQTPGSSDEAPPALGSSGLLGQARGFAKVAREARDNCQQHHSAEEQVRRRRNQSGE